MSAHHQGALDTAKLVAERAQHAELKDKARVMIDKQTKEIHQLQTWKQEWYPNVKPAVNLRLPGMKAMDHKQLDKLTTGSGRAFDLQFLDMMIKHQQGGIVMAQDALKRASRAHVNEQPKKRHRRPEKGTGRTEEVAQGVVGRLPLVRPQIHT